MRMYLAFLSSIVTPVALQAATVDINVRGTDGKPLAGAVVMIDTPKRTAMPARFVWGAEMAQRNIAFEPHVLIVPTGSTVTFPNKDKVRHHVYSFSKIKAFDLKLYGKDRVPSVMFEKPGIVALGCNIHDSMSGFIVVVDTPFAVQSDTSGRVSIAGVPAGSATVRLWHPSIRAPENMLAQTIAIAPTGFSATYVVRGK